MSAKQELSTREQQEKRALQESFDQWSEVRQGQVLRNPARRKTRWPSTAACLQLLCLQGLA